MNKIQLIKLLEIRGITELIKGQTVAQSIRNSGGDATESEMVEVNRLSMLYYIDKYHEQILFNEKQNQEIIILNSQIFELTDKIETISFK